MKSTSIGYSLGMALVAGWIVVGLVCASPFQALATSDGGLQYPGATRLRAPTVSLSAGTAGQIKQRSMYYSTEGWRQVLGWYAGLFDLELDRKPQLRGDCFQTTATEAWIVVRQTISLTLCSRYSRTTIFIDRTLSLYR